MDALYVMDMSIGNRKMTLDYQSNSIVVDNGNVTSYVLKRNTTAKFCLMKEVLYFMQIGEEQGDDTTKVEFIGDCRGVFLSSYTFFK